MPRSTLTLTVLMEEKLVQGERSTLSHTPDELQVLLIMVVLLGQRRNTVVPAGVSGQERNSVVSASHKMVPSGMVRWKENGEISRGWGGCTPRCKLKGTHTQLCMFVSVMVCLTHE